MYAGAMRTHVLLASLALALAAAPSLHAQAFEDPGGLTAGWRDVTFPSTAGMQSGRAYYPATVAGQDAPADPAQGPFPLVGLVHGQTFKPKDYDALCLHLASWGFVIVSVGPLGGALHSPPQSSKMIVQMLEWADAESLDPASFLFTMASADDWSTLGHSLGGEAMAYVAGTEPRVRAVIGLEPYFPGSALPTSHLNGFDGAVLAIGGSEDVIVPPAMHAHVMFDAATSLGRSAFIEIVGGDHYGGTDDDIGSGSLSYAEQHRLHRRVVTAFLAAQIKGDEDAWVDLLGEGVATEPVNRESGSEEPPLWALPSVPFAGSLAVGLGGRSLDGAFLAMSPTPASLPTPFGVLGLLPGQIYVYYGAGLNVEGWHEELIPVPPSLSGRTAYLQGLVVHAVGAKLTRTGAYAIP